MEPQSGPRDYRAGDDIVLELTVDHEFELEDITAIFEHEGVEPAAEEISEGNTVIELKTRRGSTPPVRAFHSAPPGKSDITSAVELRGRISAANALGEYRLARVEAGYRGRRIPFDLEGTDVRIRVVEDPFAGPRITQFRLR